MEKLANDRRAAQIDHSIYKYRPVAARERAAALHDLSQGVRRFFRKV